MAYRTIKMKFHPDISYIIRNSQLVFNSIKLEENLFEWTTEYPPTRFFSTGNVISIISYEAVKILNRKYFNQIVSLKKLQIDKNCD